VPTIYKRFVPSPDEDSAAIRIAEVAESAEPDGNRLSAAAEPSLKLAEVSRMFPAGPALRQQFSSTSASPTPRKTRTSATSATSAAAGQQKHQSCASGYPSEWADGIALLAMMDSPLDWPPSRWPMLVQDARTFLERWAGQAHRLGWQNWELWGCHRRKPWGATHGLGLVLLLGGDELVAMTETAAVIRTATGNRQTYRRTFRHRLHASERCLIWELGQ